MGKMGKTASLFFLLASTTVFAKTRVIEMETKLVDGVVHWSPERIEVKRGERIKIVANHKLVGGFDFHGLEIQDLGIIEQVDRNQPKTIEKTIPKKGLEPGEHKIGCQFHPGHIPATLVVK